jgi:hypothetical protein
MLAKAYLEDYNKTCAVYEALHPLGITLEDEERPLVSTTEQMLENIAGNHFNVIEDLLDLNSNGYISFYYSSSAMPKDKDEVRIASVEALYDFYKF